MFLELCMGSDYKHDSNHEIPRLFSPGPSGITIEEILRVTIETCQERMEQLKPKPVFK